MSRSSISRLNRGTTEQRGFTLIELMAATALMMGLVAMVLTLTNTVLTSWNNAARQLSANFGAKQAMDIMATDLESAIVKMRTLDTSKLNWMEIHTSDSNDVNSGFGRFNHIFFYAPTSIRHRYFYDGDEPVPVLGDIAAILYRIAYKNPLDPGSDKNRRFTLYRGVIDPQITFTDFLGKEKQEDISKTWKSTSYEDKLIDEFYSRGYNDNGWEYTAETMNLLALNIVALEFEPVYREVIENEVTYVKERYERTHMLPIDAEENNRILAAIDITMVVVSDEGGEIMRTLDNVGNLTERNFAKYAYSLDDETGSYILGEFAERFDKRVLINTSSF